jgi:hypothetical protein
VLVLVLVGDVGSANRDLRLHELGELVRSFFKASSHLVLLWRINFDGHGPVNSGARIQPRLALIGLEARTGYYKPPVSVIDRWNGAQFECAFAGFGKLRRWISDIHIPEVSLETRV